MWIAETEGEIRHVFPADENHDIYGGECHCNPTPTMYDNGIVVVVHNSHDGREFIERLVDPDNINSN